MLLWKPAVLCLNIFCAFVDVRRVFHRKLVKELDLLYTYKTSRITGTGLICSPESDLYMYVLFSFYWRHILKLSHVKLFQTCCKNILWLEIWGGGWEMQANIEEYNHHPWNSSGSLPLSIRCWRGRESEGRCLSSFELSKLSVIWCRRDLNLPHSRRMKKACANKYL